MRIVLCLTLAIATEITAGSTCRAEANATQPKLGVVVGYLPHYRVAGWSVEQLGPVTDLIFFGIKPDQDGRLLSGDLNEDSLTKLQQARQHSHCRVLICVGGWERSQAFAQVASDRAKRDRFISELLKFCRDHDFDGVDFDWEHPQGDEQLRAYSQLLSEAAKSLHSHRLLVTVAQASWEDLGRGVYEVVDRVHLMSYDHSFPQATLAKSTADVERILKQGCPARKVTLGIPFYGRNKAGDAKTYAELTNLRGFSDAKDEVNGYAFNGKATIAAKAKLANGSKLAGIMIWELGQDSSNAEQSLLGSLERALHK